MTPLVYVKLIADAVIAIPKIMAEIRDAYIYGAELKDEDWFQRREAKRDEIDAAIQTEIGRMNPDVEKLRNLHRARYNM